MTISTEAIKSALSALIDPVAGTDYVIYTLSLHDALPI